MLDLKKYFEIGSKITMEYIDAFGRSNEYVSQVIELYEDGLMDVLIPIHKKHDVYLRQDSLLKIVIPRGEAIYEFKAVVYEKLFGQIPLLRLKMLPEVNKIQRRNYFRLRVMKEVDARLVEDLKERKYSEVFKCNLHDISAGGMLLSSNKELQEKDMLECSLTLKEKRLMLYVIVVRRTLTDNPKAKYSYGVKFERISEFERNEITKFIFEEQRKLIKKGLV